MKCVHVCFLMQVFLNVLLALHVSDTEIVYPKRHHKERLHNDLGTLNQNGNHEEYVTYEIKSKKAHHFLDLKKIDQSHQKFIWLRSIENGKEIAVKHFPTSCYYDGKIRGIDDSYAFISTCSGGLTGTIDDGKIQYDIIPQNDGVKHNFRNVENLMKKKYKDIYGNVENHMRKKYKDIYDNDKVKKSDEKSKTITSLSEFPLLIDVEPQYVKYTKKETLYAEIFVSCDYRMLPKFDNNSSKLMERILNVYGQVDRAYQAINVRIVVVAIDIQKGASAFPRQGKDFNKDLDSFNEYVENVIKKTSPFKDVNFDNAMFLSHDRWGDDLSTDGLAFVGTICNSINSASIDNWRYNDISYTVHTIGHEFGHNMGFRHDQGKNLACVAVCLTNRGCFLLNTHNSSRSGFSTCSMEAFKEGEYPCLSNVPANSEIKVCGNGIPEGDEQCDCGTLEMCKEKGDNCCEPNNCVLKVNAQCNPLKYPECCQPSCLYKKQGTLCREADGDCDLPEYCEGDKPTCPDDKKSINGFSCVRSVKYLRGPSADTDFSSVSLSPSIITQYLKVSPKQWNGNYPCLSIAIEGCPAEQDAKFPPTSITSANLNYLNSPLCIAPNVTSCEEDVLDGTEIIYIESEHCEHDYMKFVFGAYGTLTHVCSKKKVCINTEDKLVLRKHCNDETPKFSFTNERSLQHKKSKKCVGCVSEDGWPENRCIVGLDEECDQSGNQKVIIMSTLDCAIPLLKTLPDTAFSASSTNESSKASNVLYSDGWCPDVATNAWFLIDFGQRVEISTLVIAKTKVYTTWFTLQYSDDGDSWNDYLESDPDELKKLKSVCLSGICQETLTEQCRNLPKSDVLDGPCWSILNKMKSNKKKNSICESNSNNIGVDLNGTTCAKNKFCYNKQCKSAKEHGFKCPMKSGKECSGNGVCSLDGTCVCNKGYDEMDNCFSKLKPINGKWGEWSDYTKCSTHCNGIQKRYRFCSNPAPQYRGKQCDGKSSMERACNELCLETQIRPPGDKFCIEPETGNCSVADNTELVFRSTSSYCKSEASIFVFNPKTGSLMHKCSNKFVCPKSGIILSSTMVISSTCTDSVSMQIQRTIWDTLQMTKLQKTFCLSPHEGKLINDVKVQLSDCTKKEQRLLMSGLDNGDVLVSFFENFAKMEDLKDYLNYPTTKGFVDNLDFPSYRFGTGAVRMQAYFRAPESGDYLFWVSCNDDCELLYTEDVSDISSAEKIASCSRPTDPYKWDRFKEQVSSAINLKVGKLYYLEIILFNSFAIASGAAAVSLPNGTFVTPISYEYLEKFN